MTWGQRASHFVALAGVLYHGAGKLTEAARTKALLATMELLSDPPRAADVDAGDDEDADEIVLDVGRGAAGALGAWAFAASPEERAEHAPLERLHATLRDSSAALEARRASALAASAASVLAGLESASGAFSGGNAGLGAKKMCDCAVQALKETEDAVVAKAGACIVAAVLADAVPPGAFGKEAAFSAPVLDRLAKCLKEDRVAVGGPIAVLTAVARVARAGESAGAAQLGAQTFVPLCAAHVNDASTGTRLAAERAVGGLLRLSEGDAIANDYLKTGDPPAAVKKLLSDSGVRQRLAAAKEGGLLGGDPLAPDFADPR